MMRSILIKTAEKLLLFLALSVLVLLVWRAWFNIDMSVDTWNYHLPFAARIWGLVGEDQFLMKLKQEARFGNFPMLAEFLQGMLWRITSRLQATNLVALLGLGSLIGLLRIYFKIPLALATFGFLAVPMVMMHTTLSYVDLFGHCFATLMVMFGAWYVLDKAPPTHILPLALGSGIVAANTKFQLVPLVALMLMVLALRAWRLAGQNGKSTGRWVLTRLFPIALGIVMLTCWVEIKNLWVYGNPFYPVKLYNLPGVNDINYYMPTYLEEASQPWRWLLSVFEYRMKPFTWHYNQWTTPKDPGFRMGGFLWIYVVFHLVLFVGLLWRRPSREKLVMTAVLVGLSLVFAFMPQSHILRYSMAWMMSLIGLNLWMFVRTFSENRIPVMVLTLVCLMAFVFVNTRLNWEYLKVINNDFSLVEKERPYKPFFTNVVLQLEEPRHICLVSRRNKREFYYTTYFHPGPSYRIQAVTWPRHCRANSVVVPQHVWFDWDQIIVPGPE